MTRYTCDGFRAVRTESATDAAYVFAGRLARRLYGRRGVVGSLRYDSGTRDGDMAVFSPFLGTCDDNGIVGKNEWMHVYREDSK
jgi:hypothetical protein